MNTNNQAPTENQISSFLSFKLDKELFAIPVMKVMEIVEVPTITKIPQAPEFMKGVINLRGTVLPVIDTHIKFGMTPLELTVNTCIVVLKVEIDEESVHVGALVDSVLGVFEMDEKNIQPSPTIGAKYRADFIKGMIEEQNQFMMLLDINKVFSALEFDIILESKEEAA